MATKASKDVDPKYAASLVRFLERIGISDTTVDGFTSTDSYSVILCHHLKPLSVERGRVSCLLSVKHPIVRIVDSVGRACLVAEKIDHGIGLVIAIDVGFEGFGAEALLNIYNGLHGGAVAAIAGRVSIACARTLVSEDKELFLGELSNSHLSAAPLNAELIVEGSVVRSGRSLTVIAVEFKIKGPGNGKLVYIARATFYNSPVSKL